MTVPQPVRPRAVRACLPLAFAGGAGLGVLGGMIGLGGTESAFRYGSCCSELAGLQAVIVNKALSLVVVLTACPAGLVVVPWRSRAVNPRVYWAIEG